jgi:hypothetical protein
MGFRKLGARVPRHKTARTSRVGLLEGEHRTKVWENFVPLRHKSFGKNRPEATRQILSDNALPEASWVQPAA